MSQNWHQECYTLCHTVKYAQDSVIYSQLSSITLAYIILAIEVLYHDSNVTLCSGYCKFLQTSLETWQIIYLAQKLSTSQAKKPVHH